VVEACDPSYVTSSIGGSIRWAAPEYFCISAGSRVSTVTTHGDIYSYGSVMLQVRSIASGKVRILSDCYCFQSALGVIRTTAISSIEKGYRGFVRT